jgi:hypothetical protein
MKNLMIIATVLLMGAFVLPAQAKGNEPSKSAVKFDHVVYDFGEIPYASEGSHTFTFKNMSKKAVTITNVQTSCGCTTPSYSKEPILPGKKGKVSAHYDTTRIGAFTKTMTVVIGDETIMLTIKGSVLNPPSDNTRG